MSESRIIRPPNRKNTMTEERTDLVGPGAINLRQTIMKVGEKIKPVNCAIQGFAVVFYYKSIPKEHDYAFVSQVHFNTDKVSEPQADAGWKRLRDELMKWFGKEPPRSRLS